MTEVSIIYMITYKLMKKDSFGLKPATVGLRLERDIGHAVLTRFILYNKDIFVLHSSNYQVTRHVVSCDVLHGRGSL